MLAAGSCLGGRHGGRGPCGPPGRVPPPRPPLPQSRSDRTGRTADATATQPCPRPPPRTSSPSPPRLGRRAGRRHQGPARAKPGASVEQPQPKVGVVRELCAPGPIRDRCTSLPTNPRPGLPLCGITLSVPIGGAIIARGRLAVWPRSRQSALSALFLPVSLPVTWRLSGLGAQGVAMDALIGGGQLHSGLR